MDTTVQVAIIAAATSVVAAVITFALNKRAERADALQQRKIEHYKELLFALSDVAIDGSDEKCRRRYAQSVNTIALVAPQNVISSLMRFHSNVMSVGQQRMPRDDPRNYQPELNQLLLEIRRSLDLPFVDDPSTFDFTLIGVKARTDA